MKRIVVGISGASGIVYGIRLLEVLKAQAETHLVVSTASRTTLALETSYDLETLQSMATHVHAPGDLAAPIASGSFQTDGMVIAPCSIKSLSAVAHSYNENLLIRAADVALKERRPLVLMVRETPLHTGHLRLMTQASEMGATIFPPVPAFYHRPDSVADIVDHSVGRILDIFGVPHQLFKRWQGAG